MGEWAPSSGVPIPSLPPSVPRETKAWGGAGMGGIFTKRLLGINVD